MFGVFKEEERGQCGEGTGANGKEGRSELGTGGEREEYVGPCKEPALWKGLSVEE